MVTTGSPTTEQAAEVPCVQQEQNRATRLCLLGWRRELSSLVPMTRTEQEALPFLRDAWDVELRRFLELNFIGIKLQVFLQLSVFLQLQVF